MITETETKAIGLDEELFTPAEFEAFIKAKPGWVYQRIHSKTFPFEFLKLGHFVRIRKSDALRWIASQTRPGSAV